ncbi:MAG TPA: enolase C-terminal domain-like protein [Syntrophorhabdales bacterium]|nr:enolase C-terminal domain-like protein [Syntrophorhabdales bacterium]
MARITSIHFRQIVRPLKTMFATALGRKAFLQNLLVTVVLDDGSVGIGEIPASFSRKDETIPVMKRVLQRVWTDLIGLPVDVYKEQVKRFRESFPDARMTLSGLEVALFRAFLKSTESSEHAFFGARLRQLETDITIPFVPDETALAQWITYAARRGFRIFKTKVSGNLEEDKRFLTLVCGLIEKARHPYRLRLDGNQGFTMTSFFALMDFIHRKGYPVELFEQPLQKHDLAGLRSITGAALVPVILDESVESLLDARRAIEAGACDGINVKIAKSGVGESLEIVRTARKYRLKLMIGCMTETMVGLSAAIYCAAGSAAFDFIDVDSVYLQHHRNRHENITIEGPKFVITP